VRKYYKRGPAANNARAKKRLAIKRLPNEYNGNNYNSHIRHFAIRTMQEVADIMGITKGRVHQLERYALFKIRTTLKNYIRK